MGDTLPSATQYVRAYREHRRRVGFTSDVNAEMTSPSRIPSLGSILHCFITQPVAYLRADLALALSSFNFASYLLPPMPIPHGRVYADTVAPNLSLAAFREERMGLLQRPICRFA